MTAARAPVRVLVAHNRYRQAGGEDTVFESEVALLRSGGHEVATLAVSNDDIRGAAGALGAAASAVYSRKGRKLVAGALARFRPDVFHVHNFFPQLSPAIFDACAERGVPAVWTLHNFRIACANGLLFRDGHACEECVGQAPYPAVAHRCYRGSAAASAAVAAMIGWHRARGTWHRKVQRFIALTDFARGIAVRAGVPSEKIAVKPNFVVEPAIAPCDRARSGALFAGRLSTEKGVATLVEAWRTLPDIPLTIIGDGPERAALERSAPPNVRFLGFRERSEVLEAMAATQVLVVPSLWYENFPMSLVEAMALGTPVIASRIGALESLVSDGGDGIHFAPGDPSDLARVAREAFAKPGLLDKLGKGARARWQASMSPERNLEQLLAIYREAIAA